MIHPMSDQAIGFHQRLYGIMTVGLKRSDLQPMQPLTKMLVALVAMITMFLANLLILAARHKLHGVFKVLITVIAYLLLTASLLMIVIVLFSV